MKIEIDIDDKHRERVGALLNKILSDEYILYTKTLNYHWNVVGPNFDALHLFFKRQYEALFVIIDDIAERARSIGARSYGTLQEFKTHTTLTEDPTSQLSDMQMITQLLKDHEALIRTLRRDLELCATEYKDAGTNNFLTELLEKHEKMAWMLRSCIP